MARNKRLMWRNRMSGEQGFVKAVQVKKGYFENTFDITQARKFKTVNECNQAIEQLHNMGEAVNNDFEIITV